MPVAVSSTAVIPVEFDTIFNSWEPVPPHKVVVVMSDQHQRITVPVIDDEYIDETWARLEHSESEASVQAGNGSLGTSHTPNPIAEELGTVTSTGQQSAPGESTSAKSGCAKPMADPPVPLSDDNLTSERRPGAHEGVLPANASVDRTVVSTGQPRAVLFNGLKFRLHDVDVSAAGLGGGRAPAEVASVTGEAATAAVPAAGEAQGDLVRCATAAAARPREVLQCTLKLGITDYKTSTGTTRHVSRYEEYAAKQMEDLGRLSHTDAKEGVESVDAPPVTAERADPGRGVPTGALGRKARSDKEAVSRDAARVRHAERYLASALGVDAMAVTQNGQVPLFRRSMQVGEYPGYYCCPGGHPEPSHILNESSFTAAQRGRHPGAPSMSPDSSLLLGKACEWFEFVHSKVVVQELYHSIELEVADELGVPAEACCNRGLVSVIRNARNRKPDLCFLVEVARTSADIVSTFNARGGADAFEAEEGSLVFMNLEQVRTPEDVLAFVDGTLKGMITPASFAALFHGIQCVKAGRLFHPLTTSS